MMQGSSLLSRPRQAGSPHHKKHVRASGGRRGRANVYGGGEADSRMGVARACGLANVARIVIVALHSEEMEQYLTETLPGRMEGRTLRVHFMNRSGSGEVETVLWARHLIVDAKAPLLIAASNVYVTSDIVEQAQGVPAGMPGDRGRRQGDGQSESRLPLGTGGKR